MSYSKDWDVVFEGTDGFEREYFIDGVQKQALLRGINEDDKFMAHFVTAHIGGIALRWYVNLDEETQNSWKLLREALMVQYPRYGVQRYAEAIFGVYAVSHRLL